jgi:hypothetical protein
MDVEGEALTRRVPAPVPDTPVQLTPVP